MMLDVQHLLKIIITLGFWITKNTGRKKYIEIKRNKKNQESSTSKPF